MIRLIAILPFFVCLLASPSPKGHNLPSSGVIGGKYAKEGQFPYQLSLQLRKIHVCGAALVSTNMAITAAHCTHNQDLKFLSVIAGTIDREDDDAERIYVKYCEEHKKFTPKNLEYDISIVVLKKGFSLGGRINLITIAKTNAAIPAGAYATVSGWGGTKPTGYNPGPNSKLLKFVNIPIWKQSKCQKALQRPLPGVFCGGKNNGMENACAGDSGSPMVYKNKLYGVVTFGYGCGKPSKPVVYTDVPAYRLWITRKVLGLPEMNYYGQKD